MPKQLLPLFGGRPILSQTLDRLDDLVDPARIIIATNVEQRDAVRACAPAIPKDNILVEPACRDTAPCIALSAALVSRRDPDAVLLVAPSDHVIRPAESFRRTIRVAAGLAGKDDAIYVFGVRPASPSTAYGYIQKGSETALEDGLSVFSVARFTEKPDPDTAATFVNSGEYFWNSGLYLFRVETMRAQLRTHAPAIFEGVEQIADSFGTDEESGALQRIYPTLQKISIDYAVTEKADDVKVMAVDYQWNDVGSWTSLADIVPPDADGNVIQARHVGVDTNGCIIWEQNDHLVATIGVSDLVIIHTPDATLVCAADRVQDVKALVDRLQQEGHDEVL
jgi:mannose-1-phosphate guanylyltransferase